MREVRLKGEGFFQYTETDTGDSQVGECSCAEAGRKKTAGEAGHCMAGGKVGAGTIIIRNNNDK